MYIVSHKTKYSNLGESPANFRTAALGWLESRGFFDPDGFALERNHVSFHDTREEKVERIRSLKLTHFIDDLEELFREPLFPKGVERILFAPDGPSFPEDLIHSFASWGEIVERLFAGRVAFEAVTNHA